MNILSRLNEIIIYSGCSVRAFAMRCGISQATLDKQLKGLRAISLETISNVLSTFPEISSEWLMRGIGSMQIEQKDNSAEIERINRLVDTITTLQDTINAKSETIAILQERIKQLESIINPK